MKNSKLFFFIVLLFSTATSARASAKEITYQADPKAEQKKTLLLKDFNPISMMHSTEHLVPKAKFYVIDVHSHINDAMGIAKHQDPKRVVEIMDNANVRTVVILTGLWGKKLEGVMNEMAKPFPGRFIVFAQADWSRIDEPDFGKKMAAELRESVKQGARGFKVLKDLGLQVHDKSGELVKIDDPRLDPIWEECGKLNIPVAIHSTDPEAFFLKIDDRNERYEELVEHPDWAFPSPPFPKKTDVLAARDRVFAKHPKTKFIALHFANWPENLDYVDQLLAKNPNVTVELGRRVAELGRQPARTKAFFTKYPDRIMFGSDLDLDESVYANIFRWLETKDEHFDYVDSPAQGRWKIYGLGLTDAILKKVYHENAEKLFGLKPMPRR